MSLTPLVRVKGGQMRGGDFRSTCLFLGVVVALSFNIACTRPEEPVTTAVQLSDGWSIRAAADVADDGAAVSTAGYGSAEWFAASVPSTPMAALVASGLHPDLYLGTNLEEVDTEQFDGPWWYRTEFEVSAEQAEKVARLQFAGINYSADIWLNGELLAGRQEIVGAFRVHELAVGSRLNAGSNAIAVKVYPPDPGDFTIGFVDWNPRPPDKNMGIWRPVTLRLTGDVSVDHLYVQTDVDLETLESAEIKVSALFTNHGDRQVEAEVSGRIEDISFSADVMLAPGEEQLVWFTPDDYDALSVENPRLWWPHTLGEANLYTLQMTAEVAGQVSDAAETTFGIREFDTYFNEEGHRGFTVNGQPVLIRGGGWVDDLLLSDTPAKIDAQLAYVKQMHLNTIRLEGFWGSSHYLYDAADREGILIMPGWSCQWEWEEYVGKPRRLRRCSRTGRDGSGGGLAGRPDALSAQPPEHLHLGAGERSPAPPRSRAAIRKGVGRGRRDAAAAGLLRLAGIRGQRAERGQDERALRLGAAGLLVVRHRKRGCLWL